MKKILSTVLVLLMITALTACAGGGPEVTTALLAQDTTVETVTEKSSEPEYTDNQQAILDAVIAEAENRVANAGKALSIVDTVFVPDTVFPETFDLRAVDTDGDGVTENYVTSVKQQRPFGSCWSFATIAAAETSILYELRQESVTVSEDGTKKDSIDLSEHHLVWFVYTPVTEESGQGGEGLYSQVDGLEQNESLKMGSGSTQFAAATIFASGFGPVAEPDFDTATEPLSQLNYRGKNSLTAINERFNVLCYSADDDWSVDESLRQNATYFLENTVFLASPVSVDKDGNYDMKHAEDVVASYKNELANGRAVSISYHADAYRPDQDNASAKYINSDGGTWAHYCYEQVRANHAVTVIGWDDNYSRDNFLTEIQETDSDGKPVFNEDGTAKMKSVSQPPEDGAWIVKNSWGANNSIGQGINESEWGVDGSGYFYLSYYDQSIETAECYDFYVDTDFKATLGNYELLQYNYLPTEIPHSVTCSFPVATANVFTPSKDSVLSAISCTTTKCGEEVSFGIFTVEEGQPVTDAKKLGDFTETFDLPGIHTVKVPENIEVAKGQKLIIAVTQEYNGEYLFSTGSEYNQKGFDAGLCDDRYAANAVVNPGESYIYLTADGIWWDFSEVKELVESSDTSASYITYDNFPIKAYMSVK